MENHLEMFLDRSMRDEAIFCAEETAAFLWKPLAARGYLSRIADATHVCCECSRFVEVMWIGNAKGVVAPFAPCPECGIRTVDPDVLRRWEIRMEEVLRKVVSLLEIRGEIYPLMPGILWRLGRKGNTEHLYLRRFSDSEKSLVVPAISKMPQAVVITGTGQTLCDVRRVLETHSMFSLESVAEMSTSGDITLSQKSIYDITGYEITACVKTSGKKSTPNSRPRRDSRAAAIESLSREMEQHLRAAKDHAKSTADSGNISLLPRPTQAQLAKQTELTEITVSRCLKDPQAKYLRMLWEKANDLKNI